MDDMSQFLSGTTVVEFGGYMAGPVVGRNLAALGADVIKVERPGVGDEGRSFGPMFAGEGLFFTDANHNKKSIAIDLASPAGVEVAKRLVAKADVLVENMRPGAMDALGLGARELMARNERLVYASIRGFDEGSHRANEVAYDPIIQAATGIMFQQAGADDDPPIKVGSPIVDKGSGLWSTIQILGALVSRSRTGRGAHVSTSLMAVGVQYMGLEILRFFHTGRDRFDVEPRDPGMGTTQAYACSDGRWIQIGLGNQGQFERLCAAAGAAHLLDDPNLASASVRGMNRTDEHRALAALFAERTLADWLDLLTSVRVPATAVNHISEFLADSGISERYVSTAQLTSGETVPMLLSPLDPPAQGEGPSAILPRVGAHGDEILATVLGLDPGEQEGYALRGAFGAPAHER